MLFIFSKPTGATPKTLMRLPVIGTTAVTGRLKTPERLQQVLGEGDYVVIVSFLVDKEGKITEVSLEKSVEWSGDAEVLRVIKSGPGWIPATQNGKPVIYRQRQSLTFQVR